MADSTIHFLTIPSYWLNVSESIHVIHYWYLLEDFCLHPDLRAEPTAIKQARIMLAFCLLAGVLCLGTIVLGFGITPGFSVLLLCCPWTHRCM